MRWAPAKNRIPPFSGVLGVRPNQTDRNPSALGSRIDESECQAMGCSASWGSLMEQIRISNQQIRAQYRTDHIEQTGVLAQLQHPFETDALASPGKVSICPQAPPCARSACSICSNSLPPLGRFFGLSTSMLAQLTVKRIP